MKKNNSKIKKSLSIKYTKEQKAEIKKWALDFKKSKDEFNKTFAEVSELYSKPIE